ncbi:hypothetical protein [Mycolicibacterium fortuitum]|uniref:DUF7460 domain-containing protein n=1 Tax=Mycolicibacterium fortuitum TaxID=1766 RepID=UPI003AAF8184
MNSTVEKAIALGEEHGRDVRAWGGDAVLLDGSPMSAHHAIARMIGTERNAAQIEPTRPAHEHEPHQSRQRPPGCDVDDERVIRRG